MLISDVVKDIKRNIPETGYNLVGIDDFEQYGEQLYLIDHFEKREDAEKALKEWSKKHHDKAIIYSREDFRVGEESECIWRTINGVPVCIKEHGEDDPHRNKVSWEKAKEGFEKNKRKDSFSYCPKTNKSYDFVNQKEAREFFKEHSDGINTVYVVATTNNNSGLLNSEMESAYKQVQKEGRVPLIGRWTDPKGKIFTDISFPVDAGISRREVRSLLDKYDQQSGIALYMDGSWEPVF